MKKFIFLGLVLAIFQTSLSALAQTDPNYDQNYAGRILDCDPNKKDFLVNPHVNSTAIREVAPLGNLNPSGGHVLPAQHLYFKLQTDAANVTIPTTVYLPSLLWIVAVEQVKDKKTNYVDYRIHFQPCKQVRFYFDHIKTLDPSLASVLGDFSTTSTVLDFGDSTSNIIFKLVYQNGGAVGTVGGPGYANTSFDLGVVDTRLPVVPFINTSRYELPANFPLPAWATTIKRNIFVPKKHYARCVLDYMSASVATTFDAKLGTWKNGTFYPGQYSPKCGSVSFDVAGSAQGNWFKVGASFVDETQTLSLAKDKLDSQPRFSFGHGVDGISDEQSGEFYSFTPGWVSNNFFYTVTSANQVYCYEGLVGNNGTSLPGVVLIKLQDVLAGDRSKLYIQHFPVGTCSAPPAMTGNASIYYR